MLAGGVGESGKAGQGYEERVKQAVKLFQAGYASRLIFSSGYVFAFEEAAVMKALTVSLGIPAEAILLEKQAGNTYENVKYVSEILDQHGWHTILLVSSPYHMRRVSLVFAKQAPDIWVYSCRTVLPHYCRVTPTDSLPCLGKSLPAVLNPPSSSPRAHATSLQGCCLMRACQFSKHRCQVFQLQIQHWGRRNDSVHHFPPTRLQPKEPRMTTEDFISELFYRVDEARKDVPKHPLASLWPSEVVTLGVLFALKGVGNRAF